MMTISPLGRYSDRKNPSPGNPTGEIGRADWTRIPTKNSNLPSGDEIKQLVREKAVEHVNATSEKDKDRIMGEVAALFTQYVSHVAPDRKKLLDGALKTIEQQSGSDAQKAPEKPNEPKTLFDYMIDADQKKKGMQYDRAYSYGDGATVTAKGSTVGTPNFSITQGGQEVMVIIHTGDAHAVPTPAEQTMQKEIASVWHSAYDNAKAAPMPENKGMGAGLNQFDRKA